MAGYCAEWGSTGHPCARADCAICVAALKARPDLKREPAPIGGVDPKSNGTKYDVGKVRVDLVPMRAHWEMCRVLTKGCERYGANNWRQVIGWRWRYIGAALRHIFQYMMGKRIDNEGPHPTHLHHLACALCSVSFVLEQDLCLEAGETVPDGDAIPATNQPPPPKTEAPAAEPSCVCGAAESVEGWHTPKCALRAGAHCFQPLNVEAIGSPCRICGSQGADPIHSPLALAPVR